MPRSATATRYPVALAAEARRLRAQEGLSAKRIIERLREHHHLPTLSNDTVIRWINPAYADRRNVAHQERHRLLGRSRTWQFRLGGGYPSDEYKAAFVARLRAEGVSARSILKVFRVVFDDTSSSDRALYRLVEDADKASV